MKKGRHRRFEEARALKRITFEPSAEPCEECGAGAQEPCASWCLARVPDDDEFEGALEGEDFDGDDVEGRGVDGHGLHANALDAHSSYPDAPAKDAANY